MISRIQKIFFAGLLVITAVSPCVGAEENPQAKTSNFNEMWFDTIISIERQVNLLKDGKPQVEYRTIGTGFIVSGDGYAILITAAHVVRDEKGALLDKLFFQRNDISGQGSKISDSHLVQHEAGNWFVDKKFDIACRFIAPYKGTKSLMQIPADFLLPNNEIQAGAPVLVLGYPMGLKSEQHDKPIARSGIVSRVDADKIIIDCSVFPGNSGGPVIYVPTFKTEAGVSSLLQNHERLVGVVSEAITYSDVAFSKQTNKARIVFEENSGLANIIPAEGILALLNSPDVAAQKEKIKHANDLLKES